MSVVIELPKDLNKLCRTCMRVAEVNEDSFEHKIVWNNELTELSQMLESVTTLKVGVNDGLPETLCPQCAEYMNIAYLFKNHCATIDKDLRELLLVSDTKPSSIPSEIDTKITPEVLDCKDSVSLGKRCHICLCRFESDYHLSLHLVEHNKTRNLTERFKDNRLETKASVNHVDTCIYDQIIERKLTELDNDNSTKLIRQSTSFSASDSDCEAEDSQILIECDSYEQVLKSKLDSNVDVVKEIKKTCQGKDEPIFKCPLCSKPHATMFLLSIHFLKHAFTLDISTEPTFCEACGQLFDAKELLEQHYNQNNSSKACVKQRWICSVCNTHFENESLLLIHNNSMHKSLTDSVSQGKFLCILCDESFLLKDSLITHTLVHLMKRYTCKECSVPFCTQQSYFEHLKVHPGYQYTCVVCGNLSKTRTALKAHIIGVHSNGSIYSCTICHKDFKTSGRLKTHSHIHDEQKNFMCSYCGYTTHKSGDLKIHVRSHTSERPYKCSFAHCTARFKTSSHLCGHIRRHFNIRNFVCSICGLSFGTRHSLNIHHMQHTGEKPHNCAVCGQHFRRKYHLKLHMKQHNTSI